MTSRMESKLVCNNPLRFSALSWRYETASWDILGLRNQIKTQDRGLNFCCCYCCCCCKETNATNRRSLRSWQCLSETIKFPVFYAINSFITIFTTGHQWILSWANWVICIITLSFNIHFNNILSSTSSYGPFLHVFPINCCIHSQPTILITESAYLNAAKVLNM